MRIILLSVVAALLSFSLGTRAMEPDWQRLESDSLNTLVDLIKLDTSQPAGNEYLATDYLGKRLKAEGVDFKTFEAKTGRTNIVARIKGNGSKRPPATFGAHRCRYRRTGKTGRSTHSAGRSKMAKYSDAEPLMTKALSLYR